MERSWEPLLGCWAIILVCSGYHGWLGQQIYFSQWWRLGLWDQDGFRLKAVLLRPHMAERKKNASSLVSLLIRHWSHHESTIFMTSSKPHSLWNAASTNTITLGGWGSSIWILIGRSLAHRNSFDTVLVVSVSLLPGRVQNPKLIPHFSYPIPGVHYFFKEFWFLLTGNDK